tara:strand:+ start:17 stop:625 length:609 start_codon:yes stop_codon:yes gene_type:complete
MLLANNLSFSRNKVNIFNDISLSIGRGQIKQIKGKNGSGKTTFLKTILNILLPENGEVFWEGKNIKKNIFNFYKEITLIMDEPSSTKSLTLINNINFWRGFSNSIITKNEVSLLLKAFNLEKYKDTQVMYLSSGEVKKLELLRLIIEQKKIWILDEPYNHLDDGSIEILNQTFIDHVEKNGIILFASHFEPIISNLEIINFK